MRSTLHLQLAPREMRFGGGGGCSIREELSLFVAAPMKQYPRVNNQNTSHRLGVWLWLWRSFRPSCAHLSDISVQNSWGRLRENNKAFNQPSWVLCSDQGGIKKITKEQGATRKKLTHARVEPRWCAHECECSNISQTSYSASKNYKFETQFLAQIMLSDCGEKKKNTFRWGSSYHNVWRRWAWIFLTNMCRWRFSSKRFRPIHCCKIGGPASYPS